MENHNFLKKKNFGIYFVWPFFQKFYIKKMKKNRIQQKLSVLATNHYQKSFHRDESTLCTKFYMDTSTIMVKMTKK